MFNRSQILKYYLRKKDVAKPEELYPDYFKCTLCSTTVRFKEECQLQRHIEEKHIIGGLKCSECLFSAKSRKGLRAHALYIHFHCNECSDKFENREEILDHLENVHLIKFECKTCNTRYFTGMFSVRVSGHNKIILIPFYTTTYVCF